MAKRRGDDEERKRMKELLKRAALFRTLKNDELDLIVQYSCYATYQDGAAVFTPGTNAESLFVVQRGRVRIFTGTDGGTRDVAQFIEGELFGELDLFENAPRTNGAAAEGETVLLVFPRPGLVFASLLRKHPALFARILTKLLEQTSRRLRETNKLISEKTPWLEDLRRQLLYDKLTGLYSRNYLEEDFRTSLPRWGAETSLLAVKPDNFKLINDGYGHEAGDKALRRLAEAMKDCIGGEGIAVRYRGDELMAVLPGQGEAAARATAVRLLGEIKAIDLEPIIHTDRIRLTASIGVAVYPMHSTDPAALVEKAVAAMFTARGEGGDRIC